MADVLKIRGDVLGLGKTSVEPVKTRKFIRGKTLWKTSTILSVATLALVLIGAGWGALREWAIEKEQAEQAAAAQAAAEEKAKNRERDLRMAQLTELAQRQTYELENQRKRLLSEIENLEGYKDKIPQVREFLAAYQLPKEVDDVVRTPVDFQPEMMQDQMDAMSAPATGERLKAKYARWTELLQAAGRYVEGIDRNNAYFNGYLKEMRIDEQFKREFGKYPAKATAAPVETAEPEAEPVVEAKPAPAPAARQAAPTKPRTVPIGNGGFRVNNNDW